jgi:hypothetical protein
VVSSDKTLGTKGLRRFVSLVKPDTAVVDSSAAAVTLDSDSEYGCDAIGIGVLILNPLLRHKTVSMAMELAGSVMAATNSCKEWMASMRLDTGQVCRHKYCRRLQSYDRWPVIDHMDRRSSSQFYETWWHLLPKLAVGTATALVEFVADEETVAHHNACPEKNRQLARNMEPDLGLRCMVYSRNKTKARSMVAAEDVCPAIVVE